MDGFTSAWAWMGELGSWQSATMAFLFPERHLDPTLLVPGAARRSAAETRSSRSIRGSGPFGADAGGAGRGRYLAAMHIDRP